MARISKHCQERGNSFLTIDPIYRIQLPDRDDQDALRADGEPSAWNDEILDSEIDAILSQATSVAQSIEGCWSFGYCRPTAENDRIPTLDDKTTVTAPRNTRTIQGRHYFATVDAVLEYLRHIQSTQDGQQYSLQIVRIDANHTALDGTSVPALTSQRCSGSMVLELIHLRLTGAQEVLQIVLSHLRLPPNVPVECLNTLPGGFSNLNVRSISESLRPHSHVTVYPIFRVSNWERCLQEFVNPAQALTQSEVGCLFYGFHQTSTFLFCREIFVNGPATVLHMEAVKHLIQRLLHDHILTPMYFSVMGPTEELEMLKQPLAYLKPVFQTVITGFDRIERL